MFRFEEKKKEMMGLGYLGSSSSSNLSPLAPPFTVDRSSHNKPLLNSNTVSHPSYGLPSWPYSHTSAARQEFSVDSPRTTPVHSDDYGYMIPDPMNPPTTHSWSPLNSNGKHGLEDQIGPATSHWSAVNPSPKRVPDSYSYNLSEAKPFYPPYASSVNNDDMATFTEPIYDLLSTSGLVHGGDETSQVDYTRSLSGLEYNHQREGVWSVLPERKQVKTKETDDSFFSEEANTAASLAYNDYLNQGAYGTTTLSKGKDDPSLFYYADIIRRANNTGPSVNEKSDGASSFANNHRLDPNEFPKGGSTFRAFPMFSESHPLIQSPELPREPWNNQKSCSQYEKRYHMFDCLDDRITTSIMKSSSLVIKAPAAGQGTESSRSLKNAALNINDIALKQTELHLPQGFESSGSFFAPNELTFQIGRNDDHTYVASSSTKEDVSTKLSTNDQLGFEFKARPNFQIPDINIPNVNITENVKSAANSYEHFDHHNPAEDSPCWKGAPTSYFLPFGSHEAESPQPPTKKLQTGNVVDLQGSQTDYSFNNSSGVHQISESNDKTSGPIPVDKEHTGEVVDVRFSSLKVSSGIGACYVHDTIKPKKGHGSSIESTSDADANSQTPKLELPNPEKDVISPETKIQLMFGDIEDAASLTTASRTNTDVLVKALYNLSDLLLLHCSSYECSLKEHDHESLDHVIRNLGLCMSRKVQVGSTHKSMLPQQIMPNISQEVLNETTGIVHKDQAGENHAHYQKPNSDILGKNVAKLLEHALRNEVDPSKDHNMVQAIKKVLDENLECKVEVSSENLLYKNLWLEAEAELCSLNYRARFERLKRETKKWKSDMPTDASATTSDAAIKEISSSNGSIDTAKPVPKVDSSKVSNGHVNDVEDSVMARFSILKRRGELNPVIVEEPEVVGIEVSGKGGQRTESTMKHQQDDGVVVGSGKDDVEPWVMSRLNVLKRRGELNVVDAGEKEVTDSVEAQVLGKEREGHLNILKHGGVIVEEQEPEVGGVEISGKGGEGSGWHQQGKDDVGAWVKRRGELNVMDAEVTDCVEAEILGKGEDDVNKVGSGSDWEHIMKDEFSWRLS